VRVVVTEIGWDGSMRRRALDTSGLTKAGRWEDLIEQVLAFPRRTGRLRAARSMSSTPVTALSWWVSRTSPARCATWWRRSWRRATLHSGAAGLCAGGAENAPWPGFWPGGHARSQCNGL